MADLIRFNHVLQALECTHCHKLAEVPKYVMRDPDRMLEAKRNFARIHQPCQDAIDARNRILMWGRPGPMRQAGVQ